MELGSGERRRAGAVIAGGVGHPSGAGMTGGGAGNLELGVRSVELGSGERRRAEAVIAGGVGHPSGAGMTGGGAGNLELGVRSVELGSGERRRGGGRNCGWGGGRHPSGAGMTGSLGLGWGLFSGLVLWRLRWRGG